VAGSSRSSSSSSNSSSDIMVSSMINMHMQQGDQRAIHHSW
jgi:hypothetical protein